MAEHLIGIITNMACMMMLHAAIYWPDATDATQWLMVVMHAIYLYNHMPMSGNWNFSCGPFHKEEMVAQDVS
jgi:hypothetical protein